MTRWNGKWFVELDGVHGNAASFMQPRQPCMNSTRAVPLASTNYCTVVSLVSKGRRALPRADNSSDLPWTGTLSPHSAPVLCGAARSTVPFRSGSSLCIPHTGTHDNLVTANGMPTFDYKGFIHANEESHCYSALYS